MEPQKQATVVLMLEKVSPAGVSVLREQPEFDVIEYYEHEPGRLQELLHKADVLVVRSKTEVDLALMEQAPRLKLVGRPGTGVDNIDVGAATRRGIIVMNTPFGNSVSAAEHAMGLMLAAVRCITRADQALKQGRWDRQSFVGSELNDKTLGIVGFGKIGREVAKRALSFNMKVLIFDPYVLDSVADEMDVGLTSLESLLSHSDIVSLHAPLTESTTRIIDRQALQFMKPGAFLVNAARGELVDEAALLEALQSGRIAGAGLDVFMNEPAVNAELVQLPMVVATPHIGASTTEAQEKVGVDIALQIRDYFRDGIVRNAVNFPAISLSEYRKIAPYLKLGEHLGMFLSQVSSGRTEEVTVRYYGELAEINTSLICNSILVGVLRPIFEGGVSLVNVLDTAKERGLHFSETRSARHRSYSNLLSVKLMTSAGEEWVEGTVLHEDHLHIVSVDGIDVDAPLATDMLLIRNSDIPGVIGQVGTILGNSQINIANFALGRSEKSTEAVGIVSVDSAIQDEVLDKIRALPQVLKVHRVRLA